MQDNPKISDQKGLLIAALLMIDSLHFVFARLMLPHIEPAVSAMYVMMIGMAVVGVYGFIRGQIKIDLLFKNIWFFLSVGLLVAVSTNINYEAVAFIDLIRPGVRAFLAERRPQPAPDRRCRGGHRGCVCHHFSARRLPEDGFSDDSWLCMHVCASCGHC